jgi:hypothetical protein
VPHSPRRLETPQQVRQLRRWQLREAHPQGRQPHAAAHRHQPVQHRLPRRAADASYDDVAAGLTYFVSVDGKALPGQGSPVFNNLLSGSAPGPHSVTGYVQDQDGLDSAPTTASVTVAASPQVKVVNNGNGSVLLNWGGTAPGSTVLTANKSAVLTGTGDGLTA